jgi:hypothetical protein
VITLFDDRYQLQAEIARGAIGVVWCAVDVSTGERVAVKTLREEAADVAELVAGLEFEAGLLADLDHVNVQRVLGRTSVHGAPAFVMDLAPGGDLRRRLRAAGPFAPAAVARIGTQVADALAHVHAMGVVHCDVKPANLLIVTPASDDGHAAPVAAAPVAPPPAEAARWRRRRCARRLRCPPDRRPAGTIRHQSTSPRGGSRRGRQASRRRVLAGHRALRAGVRAPVPGAVSRSWCSAARWATRSLPGCRPSCGR